jgi:hypothetical protein
MGCKPSRQRINLTTQISLQVQWILGSEVKGSTHTELHVLLKLLGHLPRQYNDRQRINLATQLSLQPDMGGGGSAHEN